MLLVSASEMLMSLLYWPRFLTRQVITLSISVPGTSDLDVAAFRSEVEEDYLWLSRDPKRKE